MFLSTVPQNLFPTNTDSVLFFSEKAPRALISILRSAKPKVQKFSKVKIFKNIDTYSSVQQQETKDRFLTGNYRRPNLSVEGKPLKHKDCHSPPNDLIFISDAASRQIESDDVDGWPPDTDLSVAIQDGRTPKSSAQATVCASKRTMIVATLDRKVTQQSCPQT